MTLTVPLLVPVLSDRHDGRLRILVVCWVLALGFFWSWWLQPQHWVTPWGMAFNSLLLAWTTGLSGYPFLLTLRGSRPNPVVTAPADLRVAMIVTKAPSEPWPVVRATLEAMLVQRTDRPFAIWLADERPSRETFVWCVEHGVQISTRFGVDEYHQPTYPRRTKCKEGNLAFFYDHYGYEMYDVVAQFDADHVPTPTYLEEILRPFAAPEVGYVSAPSICDANIDAGWTVRARLFKEATLQGIVQAGCNDGFAPVCIGSHYAVRTQALRDIGGIGPELAEDFSTTFLMNSAGWQGVFAIDAEAHGEGPESAVEMLVQEMQWARSLATVWARYTKGKWASMPRRARWRLRFALAFYPIFATQMIVGLLFPVVALAMGAPWVRVSLFDFWAHVLPVSVMTSVGVAWMRRRGVLRPHDAELFGWESFVFTLARWPWVAIGFAQGWWAGVRKRTVSFKVTTKGDTNAKTLPVRYVAPMLGVALVMSAAPAVFDGGRARGYAFLCAVAAVSYLTASTALVALHLKDNRRRRMRSGMANGTVRERLPFGLGAAIATSTVTMMTVGLLVFGLS